MSSYISDGSTQPWRFGTKCSTNQKKKAVMFELLNVKP